MWMKSSASRRANSPVERVLGLMPSKWQKGEMAGINPWLHVLSCYSKTM